MVLHRGRAVGDDQAFESDGRIGGGSTGERLEEGRIGTKQSDKGKVITIARWSVTNMMMMKVLFSQNFCFFGIALTTHPSSLQGKGNGIVAFYRTSGLKKKVKLYETPRSRTPSSRLHLLLPLRL